MGHRTVQDPPLSGPSLLMRPSAGEFNLEVQHTSKVKDIHSFPLFLRRPETGKLLGITLIPPVKGLGGFLFVSKEEYHLNVVLMLLQEDY